ncbi:MAG TPA: hypothetical protein VFA36_05950, partial [Burkholderiales bacterium]|nr:hypothetical protein [Burkholderiales bacterium]
MASDWTLSAPLAGSGSVMRARQSGHLEANAGQGAAALKLFDAQVRAGQSLSGTSARFSSQVVALPSEGARQS